MIGMAERKGIFKGWRRQQIMNAMNIDDLGFFVWTYTNGRSSISSVEDISAFYSITTFISSDFPRMNSTPWPLGGNQHWGYATA